MQLCSGLLKSFKHQGYSFSVLKYFCRRCKLITQTGYLLGIDTPCYSIPFTRQFSSWNDSKGKTKTRRNISRAKVLKALAVRYTKEDIRKIWKANNINYENMTYEKFKYNVMLRSKALFFKVDVTDIIPNTDKETDKTEARKHKEHFINKDIKSVVQSNGQMLPSTALLKFCTDIMVPFDNESSFSAPIALHHLCEVTEVGTNILGDGTHTAVIVELLDLAQQKITTAEDILVLDFVIYNFKVNGLPHGLFRVASNKLKFSMDSNKYSLLELLDISSKLQSFDSSSFNELKSKQLGSILSSIWDFISLRKNAITCSILANLYKGAPVAHKKIFSTLQRSLCSCIYELEIQDVLDILSVQQQTKQDEKLEVISEWVKSTLEKRTVDELEKLMNGYLQCEHVCPVMIEYLPSIADLANSKSSMTIKLIGQLVSYCANGLCRNDHLLTMACDHYMDNTDSYTSEDLHTLLHAVGVLNFLPPTRKRLFFSKVEDYLSENFYNIEVSMVLEIFVYLLYMNKVAVNFARRILSPFLIGIVFEFEEEKRMKAVHNLELLRNVFSLRGVKHTRTGLLSNVPHRIPSSDHHSSTHKATMMVTDSLCNIVGKSKTVRLVRRPTSMTEKYIELDYMELAKWAGVNFTKPRGKFIILPLSEESFCKDTNIMIGPESTNLRMLIEQGHTVAELHLDNIEKLQSANKFPEFLQFLLMQQVLERKDMTDVR